MLRLGDAILGLEGKCNGKTQMSDGIRCVEMHMYPLFRLLVPLGGEPHNWQQGVIRSQLGTALYGGEPNKTKAEP